eukprot:5379941-Prymnesium_polylepis.1
MRRAGRGRAGPSRISSSASMGERVSMHALARITAAEAREGRLRSAGSMAGSRKTMAAETAAQRRGWWRRRTTAATSVRCPAVDLHV